MKKRKKNKIAENFSSGAEKVESIVGERETGEYLAETQMATGTSVNAASAMNTAANGGMPFPTATVADLPETKLTSAEKEAIAAKRRVQKAMEKQQKKERAERLKKERIQKVAAIKRERTEKAVAAAKNWREGYRVAMEQEKKKLRAKQEGGDGGDRSPKRAPGFGGWLAAVVTLGATTLVLSTVVAVGAVNMSTARSMAAASARGVLYEFVSVVEDMEEDLDEVRVVTSATLQSELLSDVALQARMAEGDLEKLPLESQADKNLTAYLNGTAYTCEGMLAKLRSGEKLSARDEQMLETLHEVSEKVTDRLGQMMQEMQDKDMMTFLSGKECCIGQTFRDLEDVTLSQWKDERRIPPRSKESPSMEGRGESTLTSNQAKEMCLRYFADYGVQNVMYDGETVSREICVYNFSMTDEKGVRLFAQISEKDGALVSFDYYEECTQKTVDEGTCLKKAREFLEKLGYEDMTATRVSAEGTNLDITFVREADDVLYYDAEVQVKVCMQRGKTVGFNAAKFLKNDGSRYEFDAKITMQEAREGISEKLTVQSSRAVVIPYRGRVYSAYEFFCSYDGEFYFVYADAVTGNQLFVENASKG